VTTEAETNEQPALDDSREVAASKEQNMPEAAEEEMPKEVENQEIEGDDDQDGAGRGEAKQRRRAQKAERERDELRDTLQRTRQSIVDKAVQTSGLDPRLLAAAGHTLDSLVGDNDLIDHAALADAVTATKREFRVSNGLQPNPQQGHGGGVQARGEASWSKALKSG
jgi:hypothetical protein